MNGKLVKTSMGCICVSKETVVNMGGTPCGREKSTDVSDVSLSPE